jgi:Baseplate J-like protein
MSQQNVRIVAHTVRMGDTLERLARDFLGDAAQWLQLAILNRLDYPYLSDDGAFPRDIAATGTALFTRSVGSTVPVTIPSGSVLTVPERRDAQGNLIVPVRSYTTDTSATIPSGQPTASVTVTAIAPGDLYNVAGDELTGLTFTLPNLASVTNPDPITGGANLNVKLPGEKLLVYADAGAAAASAGVNTQALSGSSFYTALLGVDIGLDQTGDLQADARGGIATVSGLANLQNALERRLATDLGWYAYYPGYGTGIEKAVGQAARTYWLSWAGVEAERTVRTDPRVVSVANLKAAFSAGVLTLTMDILVIGEQTPQNLILTVATNGGA